MPARPARPVDDGVTLVEVLVAMCLMGIMAAFAVGGFRDWQAASDHRGTAYAIQTVMRQTQVRAVSEGVSFCILFNDGNETYTVNRYACNDSPQRVDGPLPMAGPSIRLSSPVFTTPDGSPSAGVTFRPTGAAWPGTVKVTRPGTSKQYVLSVEGFTGRVSLT